VEEGAGLGVAAGAEDAHEGFGGVAEGGGEWEEADGSVDVHAEEGFGSEEVAGEEGSGGVDEELAAEGGVLADEGFGGLVEGPGEGHGGYGSREDTIVAGLPGYGGFCDTWVFAGYSVILLWWQRRYHGSAITPSIEDKGCLWVLAVR